MSSRRKFMTGSALALAAIAGCVSSSDDSGDGETDANGTGDTGDENGEHNGGGAHLPDMSEYSTWVPAEIHDEEDWFVGAFSPAAIAPYGDDILQGTVPFGAEPDAVELQVVIDSEPLSESDGTVISTGDFDPESVVSAFEEVATGEISEDSAIGSYNVYSSAEEAIAVTEDVVVLAVDIESLELGIDTVESKTEPLSDVDGRFERFEQSRDTADVVIVEASSELAEMLLGVAYETGETESAVSIVMTGDDEETLAEVDEKLTAVSDGDESLDEFDIDWTYEREGTVLHLSGTYAVDPEYPGALESATALFQFVDRIIGREEPDPVVPVVSFDYNYDTETGELTIFQQAGDALTASNVRFEGENIDQDGQTWAEVADIEPDDTVRAGDRVTLTVESGFQLDVVWTGDDGTAAVIASQDEPDA